MPTSRQTTSGQDNGPSWKEFTTALTAQRAEISDSLEKQRVAFKEMLEEIKDEIHSLALGMRGQTEELKNWVEERDKNAAEKEEIAHSNFTKEIDRLDKRINTLTTIGVGVAVTFIGSVIAFVIDVFKIKLTP